MHATGIGLILKAIQDLDEKQSSCLIEENKKEENQEEQINPEESVVKKKRFGKKIEDFLRGIIGEGKE